jgi:hypothetical protein
VIICLHVILKILVLIKGLWNGIWHWWIHTRGTTRVNRANNSRKVAIYRTSFRIIAATMPSMISSIFTN